MKKIVFLLNLIFATLSMAQIEVSLPDTSADADTSIIVPIKVSDLTGLNVISYQIEISYDTTVVRAVDISVENTLTESWGQLVYNLNIPGKIEIGAYDVTPLEGGGNLVAILFDVVGQPFDSTALIFEYCEFPQEYTTVETYNGTIKINTNIINVTVATNIPGSSEVIVDDTVRTVPFKTTWLKKSHHKIEAISPQEGESSGVRYIFTSWSDGGALTHTVTSRVDTAFVAYFSPQYYLTILSDLGTPTGEGWYDSAAVANFSVDEYVAEGNDTRHNFAGWIGSGENSYSGETREATVVMTNPITEQATWLTEYYLTVKSPYGNPFGEGWYQAAATATFGIDSTEIVKTWEKYYFNSWVGDGNGSYSGPEPQNSIVINNPVTETANWDIEYFVEINSDPAGLVEIAGSGWYTAGFQLAEITAPDSASKDNVSYYFKHWLVNGTTIAENPLTINVDSALVITAVYDFRFNVVVTTNIGSGTRVLVDGNEHDAPYTTHWFAGDTHTIGVEEYQAGASGVRYAFSSWSDGGERNHTVQISTDMTFTATLQTEYYLTIISNPEGLFSFEGSGWYIEWEPVMLPEAPEIGVLDDQTYRFKTWKINNEATVGNPITITMDAAKIAEAYYEKAFNISGKILEGDNALQDVQLILTGAENDTFYSDANGEYIINALLSGDYTVTPRKYGYKFEPESRNYLSLSQNFEGQDFVGIDTLTAINIDEDNLPQNFALEQNYPNPFNNATIIKYKLPQKSKINLTIYNLMGQAVRNLVSGTQKAGNYLVLWDGKDEHGNKLPSSVYFYKLEIDKTIISKKMIMLF